MNTEPFGQHATQTKSKSVSYATLITHTVVAPTFSDSATQFTFAGYHVNTQLSGGGREQGGGPRWPFIPITAPRRQHWAAAPIPIVFVKRSRSQLFLSIRFGGATALTEKNRDVSFELRMESGGLHAQFEGIITVLLH